MIYVSQISFRINNFTMIAVLHDNDVLTWDYKNSNKYQVQCYNQLNPEERSKFFSSRAVYHVRLTKIPSTVV